MFAWKIITLIAVLYPAAHEQVTSLFQESAFFISRSATFAISHSDSPALNIILIGKVAAAYTAVHAAGSNQLFIHLLPLVNVLPSSSKATRGKY